MAILTNTYVSNDQLTSSIHDQKVQCIERVSSASSMRTPESPSSEPSSTLAWSDLEQANNAVFQDSKDANSTSLEYGHHPLHDTTQRPMHVLIVGSGPSGISVAVELAKLPHVTFQIFEKNGDVGGTWYENHYPGAACDVASHSYQWSFLPNPEWSHHFAPAEEIGEYIKGVVADCGIYQNVNFNSRVSSARWDESFGRWRVEVEDLTTQTFYRASGDILVNAGGILNNWKWPDIPGLHSFKGKIVHTAAWDDSVELEGKRIGVIGSGATSIQVVPAIQPKASALEVFLRSPTYILPTVGFGIESSTFNEKYTDEQKKTFREDASKYRSFRKQIEQQMNENFSASIRLSAAQTSARRWAEEQMRSALSSSPELQEKLIPDWELGCRRITPGLPYLQAVQRPNVSVERVGIEKVVHDGIQTADGRLHAFDVIVCATGFDTSFSGGFPIVGRGKQSIQDRWRKTGPEAYLGLSVAGCPNYFAPLGPNCPIANGSLFPCIEGTARYIRLAVEKMQKDQIRSVEVKKTVQDRLNDYMQRVHKDLVWSGKCVSWYKDRNTNKVTAVWPGSSIHYLEMIEQPRWEDFDIRYCDEQDPFAFMGDGRSQREFHKRDLAYYLDCAVAADPADQRGRERH